MHRVFHLIKTPKTWSEAQSFCRENYIDLATVDNMEEHKRLIESIGSAGESIVWIGLERSATERWAWSEGIKAEFGWNGKPDDGKCVYLGPTGNWHADHCSHLRPFICFKCKLQQ